MQNKRKAAASNLPQPTQPPERRQAQPDDLNDTTVSTPHYYTMVAILATTALAWIGFAVTTFLRDVGIVAL